METKYISYDVEKSSKRIDEILDFSNSNFEESDSIPSRSKLTFSNGFYTKVCSIFIDIRKSSELTGEHRRPKLAKLYRSYISETVAILNGYSHCKEIEIVGDCVSATFEGQYKYQIDSIVNAAAQINSLIKILNYKYRKKGIVEIEIGIGISFGRALMIKTGYSGSTINDVVWMGDVVNEASNYCNKANKDYAKQIIISSGVYDNLNEHHQSLFSTNIFYGYYEGDLINTHMDKWYEENCK